MSLSEVSLYEMSESSSSPYTIKLRHILPAYVTIALGTSISLLLIRWLFCIQFDILEIKEEKWELWLPLLMPWVTITIWLRKRLRILTFKNNDKGRFFFQFLCWLTTAGVCAVSQSYLTTATGKLENLNKISEITAHPKARYYKLATYIVSHSYNSYSVDFRTSGKYNQDFNMRLYFIAPLLDKEDDSIPHLQKFWYGVSYHKQISNSLSEEEKNRSFDEFYEKSFKDWEEKDLHSIEHFERVPASDNMDNFLKAVKLRINEKPDNSYIILKPIKNSYASRNGNKMAWVFGILGIGTAVLLLAFIWPGVNRREYQRQLAGLPYREKDDLIQMLQFLVPKDNHYATSILINLNILVFLTMILSGFDMLSPNGKELLAWGGNNRLETAGGDWWRLITSMFVHGGIMHLIMNIAGLVIASFVAEPLFGRKRFFLIYIISGIIGSLTSILWYENVVSVGASGAIFGLFGAILGLLLTNRYSKDSKKIILLTYGAYVAINLVWGLTGGVDNAAHIGGLISGIVLGILLNKVIPQKLNNYL